MCRRFLLQQISCCRLTHSCAVVVVPPCTRRLEWTQAHLDFQQLFEFQLEQFVGSQDFTQAQFVAACQDALDANSSSSCEQLPVSKRW